MHIDLYYFIYRNLQICLLLLSFVPFNNLPNLFVAIFAFGDVLTFTFAVDIPTLLSNLTSGLSFGLASSIFM